MFTTACAYGWSWHLAWLLLMCLFTCCNLCACACLCDWVCSSVHVTVLSVCVGAFVTVFYLHMSCFNTGGGGGDALCCSLSAQTVTRYFRVVAPFSSRASQVSLNLVLGIGIVRMSSRVMLIRYLCINWFCWLRQIWIYQEQNQCSFVFVAALRPETFLSLYFTLSCWLPFVLWQLHPSCKIRCQDRMRQLKEGEKAFNLSLQHISQTPVLNSSCNLFYLFKFFPFFSISASFDFWQ